MSSRMPPVPPANRSKKGTGEEARPRPEQAADQEPRKENPDSIGRTGNTKINTTNKGLQQDR